VEFSLKIGQRQVSNHKVDDLSLKGRVGVADLYSVFGRLF
jgi:hypothetical protein